MNHNLTMADRAVLYRDSVYGKKFPASTLHPEPGDGRVYGWWMIGNDYRNKSKLYGAYPRGLLDRLMAMYPDAERVLHVFSGSLPPGPYVRFDLSKDRIADVYGDAQELSSHFGSNSFDLVVGDPPYGPAEAVKYGTPMPNRAKVLREIYKVLEPGGHLVWLDRRRPMYRKSEWRWQGVVGILRSTNHEYRGLEFFQRQA